MTTVEVQLKTVYIHSNKTRVYMLLCCSHPIPHLTNWCTKTKNLFDCSGNHSHSFTWSCPLPTCWLIYI